MIVCTEALLLGTVQCSHRCSDLRKSTVECKKLDVEREGQELTLYPDMAGEGGCSCFGRIVFLVRGDGRKAGATGDVTMRNLWDLTAFLVVDCLLGSCICSRDLGRIVRYVVGVIFPVEACIIVLIW